MTAKTAAERNRVARYGRGSWPHEPGCPARNGWPCVCLAAVGEHEDARGGEADEIDIENALRRARGWPEITRRNGR